MRFDVFYACVSMVNYFYTRTCIIHFIRITVIGVWVGVGVCVCAYVCIMYVCMFVCVCMPACMLVNFF